MKLTKSVSLAVIGAIAALGVCGAKAAVVGITTNYSKLTISATIQTNNTYTYKNGVYKYTVATVSLNNKSLLGFMTNWVNTVWPTGAQLIYDWNSDQVCVADKTGTNILFYAGDGISNATIVAYLDVEWNFDGGVYNGTDNENSPGSDTWTESYIGYFQLYYSDSTDSSTNVNLYADGLNKQGFSQKWDENHNYTTWTDSESFTLGGAGDLNGSTAVFKGTVHATGKGKGANPYWYPN